MMVKRETPLLLARRAKGLSMPKLATLANTSPQQIDRLEKGERKLTKEWALRLAPHLGITPEELLFGIVSKEKVTAAPTISVTHLKLLGYVEAGAWREVSQAADDPEQEVILPRDERFPKAAQFALEVRGDSMNAAKPTAIAEGAKLRCVDFYESGLDLKTGQIVVVQRTRDGGHLIETTVKRVAILSDRIELRPESTNPAHLPLIWNEATERSGETKVIAIVTGIVNDVPV